MSKQSILEKYGVLPGSMLGSGMEADVYAYGASEVLKIYQGTVSSRHISILKAFYDSLDAAAVPYALPRIFSFEEDGPYIVSIEKRLLGEMMSARLRTAPEQQRDVLMDEYLAAILALQKMDIPLDYDRYKLYDQQGLSQRSLGDWHHFLARYLDYKCTQISGHLAEDVAQYAVKMQKLHSILAHPYEGEYRVIHGDFFPGNLLVDANGQVTALLDFGLLTMYGDPLFDLATGWVLFDMYDELQANLCERYLGKLVEAVGCNVLGKLHRYVLLYSIFTANTYSPDCSDGHYAWCIHNLNNDEYWQTLG